MAPAQHNGDEPNGRLSATEENTPLIDVVPPTAPLADGEEIKHYPGTVYRQTVFILIFSIMFIGEIGGGMIMPPTNVLMEDILCRAARPQLGAAQRHPTVIANDPYCKSPEVQSKLALYKGWLFIMEALPGALLSIPYGMLADRWGRKPVFLLSLAGIIIGYAWYLVVLYFPDIFPLWCLLLFPGWTVLGGGFGVLSAMIYTIIADVVPVATRAMAFFELSAVMYISEFIASPLAGYLMGEDGQQPWIPLLVAYGSILLASLITCFLPETLGLRTATEDAETVSTDEPHEETHDETVADKAEHAALVTWKGLVTSVKQVWTFIFRDTRVAWLLFSLLFLLFGRFVQEILMQYATKRYDWSWTKASYWLSIRSFAQLVTYLFLLRMVSYVLTTRYSMLPIQRDVFMARVSGVILVSGCLIIALAVNVPLFMIGVILLAMGSGIRQLIISLLNSLVEPHHLGMLNGVVGVLNMGGLVIAAELMSETLSTGVKLGGLWIGLPFFIAAAASAISTVVILLYRAPAVPPADILGENPAAERYADEEAA